MIIRFASAASAVALVAGLATPAFAGEAQAADAIILTATEDAATDLAATDLAVTDEIIIVADSAAETEVSVRAIAPIDLDDASYAEDGASGFTLSGSVGLVSDYRFRGVSQTDEGIALQGGFTLSHDSGFYVGTWASNLAGWGTFGGSNTELDLFAGYSLPVGEGGLDVGFTWFMYPSGADTTDFVEFYAKLSGDVGPLGLTAGVAYAPSQEALGNAFPVGAPADPGDKEDNLYLFGDAVFGITDTPISLKAHLGYSDGNPGLGPNGTSIAPTGTYFDWLLGVDVEATPGLTLGVAYVDTSISEAEANLLRPNFATLAGDSISDAQVVFSVTASF